MTTTERKARCDWWNVNKLSHRGVSGGLLLGAHKQPSLHAVSAAVNNIYIYLPCMSPVMMSPCWRRVKQHPILDKFQIEDNIGSQHRVDINYHKCYGQLSWVFFTLFALGQINDSGYMFPRYRHSPMYASVDRLLLQDSVLLHSRERHSHWCDLAHVNVCQTVPRERDYMFPFNDLFYRTMAHSRLNMSQFV